MRTLYFLVPGTGAKFACGGLWAELKTFNLAKQVCNCEVVTYRQREKDTLFLDQVLQQKDLSDAIFVISWGFDITKLVAKLKQHNVVYHAHSAGYKFSLPASMPIITVSRNTMGYWGQKSPNSLIYYLPNQISEEFSKFCLQRDIDVLVQKRKSSSYLMNQLIPALQKQCNVVVVDAYVEDLAKLFNRAKVYLYDSAEYWALQGVSEGFGLQPLEAMACGCQVFSSINNGLSDYLDPGFNCYKIAGYSKEYDVRRILQVVERPLEFNLPEYILNEYRVKNITQRLQIILQDINNFFDGKKSYSADIKNLTPIQRTKLLAQSTLNKLKKKLSK
ncbi:MAG: glycosyltransferase [Chroococcus sp. CMT-3BRIN-NPC107]|jgi:glycosyltransferase involved in cell wall biosynthesis|nr:glycosyltransferase [Chroococcus sp. CMT-3BRIN-NPC107]